MLERISAYWCRCAFSWLGAGVLGCIASVSSAFAMPDDLRIEEDGGDTFVYWGDEVLLRLKQNRHIYFRATPENDHWIGTPSHPSDLAWAYNDFKGLVDQRVTHRVRSDGFAITISGRKPDVDVKVEIEIDAQWDAGNERFAYVQSSRIAGNLEHWYQNSQWAGSRYDADSGSRPPIEASDYHLSRISTLDRLFNKNAGPDLYRGVYYTRGEEGGWERIPKLPIAYPVNSTDLIYDFWLPHGGRIGYLDEKEGGWIVDFVDASVPEMRVELCWSWYDVHNVLEEAIPPRHSRDEFEVHYTWKFAPVGAEEAASIMREAEDVPWRETAAYDLPAVSWNNRFDREFRTDTWEFPWWRSTAECVWDKTVGYDDDGSLRIDSDGSRPKAWYTFTWLYPFSWEPYLSDESELSPARLADLPDPFDLSVYEGRKFKVTALVRTEGLDGEAFLAVAQGPGPIWLYSDRRSPEVAQEAADRLEWQRSEPVSGTSGWEERSLVFTMDTFYRYIVLEQRGSGRSWFDNVVIEEVTDLELARD